MAAQYRAQSIERMPLEMFYTPGICLDLSHIPPRTPYAVDDIQAALLIQQIGRLNDYRQRRQYLDSLYRELLMDIDD